MTDNATLFAQQRNRENDDFDAKQDRRARHYESGRRARAEGLPKTANPLRRDPDKFDPDHPDIWEAQWDLGWDEG